MAETNHNFHRKRKQSEKAPDVYEAFFEWFHHATDVQNIPVSGYILRDKDYSFKWKISVEDLCPTIGWIGLWKKHYNVVFIKTHIEKRDADHPDTDECIINTLPEMLKQYKPWNVFNDEETGL